MAIGRRNVDFGITKPSAPPAATSNAVTPAAQPELIPAQADTAPGKIDRSVLTTSEPLRLRDKAHLKFAGTQHRLSSCALARFCKARR